jgi:hypothetical protein
MPLKPVIPALNELQRARKHFQTLVVFLKYVSFWCQMMILIRFFHILTIDGVYWSVGPTLQRCH